MNAQRTTALKVGLISCHDCHLLVSAASLPPGHPRCPRCGAALHARKPGSITRAWAFLLAAAIMYIPANLLPMTVTYALGTVQSDTIISGVIYFIHSGSWEIAIVIFVASIFVPMAKLAIMTFLLLSVQLRLRWRPRDRTVLYRVTEVVGRWSMVDVYVVTILVGLVKLGGVASIEAGPAAVFFACVVVLTMLAAESFDPRIIWDVIEEDS
ncbi:paraquat-inducible protein A [Desulfomicrobium norvegicum]|uniref:Paraquat-inducible protein A n=1 Tax=Desulfomicrobium norvegicum (strain DSM 1741 / NCIMB 8310) TaxID=52561 RepID=A0A8G2F4R6_DESNO|nr:paraquat-inducible protein A [Desulfomicrobium norvegicum]SFL79772.1 paraquat-inducible protein A [Desulfomicrobium norvegicum]